MIYVSYLLTTILLLVQLFLIVAYWKHRSKLGPDVISIGTPKEFPLVSLIFTAKDEAQDLPRTLAAFEKINYPELEIIAVNDRSQDETGNILSSWKSKHHFKFLNIEYLPEGWLGKTHALHKASQLASGKWLLLTDADVRFSPYSISHAISRIQTQRLDFLSLAPHLNSPSFMTQATMEFFNFFFVLLMKPWLSGQNKGKAIGVGSFNLISAELYRSIGGHETIRLSLDDDLQLAAKAKSSGGNLESLNGSKQIEIVFYRSLLEMQRGFEKNVIQAFDFSLPKAFFAIGFTYLVFALPFFLSLKCPWFLPLFLLQITTHMVINHQFGYPKWRALLLPLTSHIYIWTMLRSCILAKVRNAIIWRGQQVKLKVLKDFQVSLRYQKKSTNLLKDL